MVFGLSSNVVDFRETGVNFEHGDHPDRHLGLMYGYVFDRW